MSDDKTVSIRICQEGHANALALNKDCSQIAVAGRSLLKIFSIESNGFLEVCNLRGGKNHNLSYSSNDVAWSSLESNILATAATNGVVAVWDLSKFGRHKQLHVYNEHERTAHSVTFHSTEAHILISGSQDGTIKCFDLRNDKVAMCTYFSNSESVRDIKFSPHSPNTFAAVSENGTVQIWDLRRPDRCKQQFTAHSGPIYTCDWHPTFQWLATGSRDKQIKVWNMATKPSLEYTIHTIAVVGRVKWRPERTYNIASSALVMDYSIYIWDVRRPYIPYVSFNEHTNVTTGIAFKGNDPHTLLSTSKDSTVFKHAFQDAINPSLKTNPQSATINYKGDLLFAYKMKMAPPLQKPTAKSVFMNCAPRQKINPAVERFLLAKSNLESFTTKIEKLNGSIPSTTTRENIKTSMLKDFLAFSGFAKEYILTGKSLPEICENNYSVALKYGKNNVASLWNFVKELFSHTQAKPSNKVQTLLQTRYLLHPIHLNNSARDENSKFNNNSLANTSNSLNDEHLLEFKSLRLSSDSNKNPSRSCFNNTIEDAEISNCEFIFGDEELTIENMDCVKSFRNGFLYTGPNDLIKDWYFPSSIDGHDIHAGRSRKDKIDVAHRKMEISPPPDPPSYIKIVSPMIPPTWEPYQVLADSLTLQTDIGDVQTSICIIIALGQRRNDLPIDEYVHESWLLSYIDLLQRHQMITEATEIINLSWIPRVCELNLNLIMTQ